MNQFLIVIFLTIFIHPACSNFLDKFERAQPKNFTEVRFSSSNRQSIVEKSVLAGGVLIYAISATLIESIYIADESTGGVMNLPNDSYKFLAVGWDAGQLTGNTYCGLGSEGGSSPGAQIALDGTPVLVSMNLTTANCASTNFSDPLFINGTNFILLSLVFCGAATDLSSKIVSNSCTGGEESAMFLLGNNTAVVSAHDGTPDQQTLLFTADTLAAGVKQLYATSFLATGGKSEIKLNKKIIGTNGVTKFSATPSGTHVVYIADQDTAIPQLYITPVYRQSPSLLSSAITGVVDFRISPDSSSIVYIADENTSSKLEVYSINIDGTNHQRLNSAMIGVVGVKVVAGKALLEISPDSTKAVYIAEQDSAGVNEIYMATIGTAASSDKRNTVPVGGGNIDQLEITPDSSRVVFRGDIVTDNKFEIFQAPLVAAAPQTKISSNSGTVTQVQNFFMDKHYNYPNQGTGKISYIADSITTNIQELHSVDPDGTNHITLTSVGGVSGDGVRQSWFSPDGSKIAYSRQIASDANRIRLFIINVDGTGNTELTDNTAFTGAGMPSPGSNQTLVFSEDGTKIAYIADQDAGGEMEVWSANDDGTGRTKISGAMVAGGNASSLKIGGINGDLVVYNADQVADTQNELFSVGITGTPAATVVNPALAGGYSIPQQYHVFDNGDKVLYPAILNALTAEEMYIKTIGGTNDKVGTTTTYGTPVGKYRIHLLAFNGSPSGTLFNSQYAISSACKNGPASDGIFTMSTLYIPTGTTSSTVPFGVAIEIFPRASACSGNSIVHYFPLGIAQTGAASTEAKLLGDGVSNLRLFIND